MHTDEHFRLLFENSFDALLLTDSEGNVYKANSAAEELFGYTKEELYNIGRGGLADLTDPGWLKAIEERNSTGKFIGILRCIKKDGTIFPCEVSSRIFRTEDGSVFTSTSVRDVTRHISTDITEYKKMQNELFLQRELFESIFDSIPVMIIILDPAFKNLRFNNELLKVLGWTEEEVKDNFGEKVFPDPSERQAALEFMQSSEPEWKEFRLTAKDGRLIESSWSRIKISGNTNVGIGIDLSSIKQAEMQLRETQAGLIKAQKLAHIGNWYWDIKTDKLTASDEILRIYGLDPKKDKAPTLEEQGKRYFSPENFEIIQKAIENALKTGNGYELDIELIRNGEKAWITNRVETVKDHDENVIALNGTIQDITEIKATELKLKRTLEELERSNKELEQFAYVASHDLQEPLRMVSNFARLISKQYSDKLDETADRYIDYMVDGTKRMQSLISDLLQYARLTTKAQPFVLTDLNQIMEYVQTDLRMLIEEKKAIVNYEELPTINADPVQIRQLFQNLIWNAIKFKSDKDPEIYISVKRASAEWIFSIKDNGIGIAPQFFQRIFVIFQRLHEREKYPGTGIGLTVCKKIVEHHGGKIWVESEEGKGSTFYFSIKN